LIEFAYLPPLHQCEQLLGNEECHDLFGAIGILLEGFDEAADDIEHGLGTNSIAINLIALLEPDNAITANRARSSALSS
jgi:hypothetical protein